jgi:hypothetical protein
MFSGPGRQYTKLFFVKPWIKYVTQEIPHQVDRDDHKYQK